MGVVNKRTLTKTRRKTRDVDQIKADLASPAHLARHTSSKAAEDLPGLGRHYCISCAKWYESADALVCHRRGKPHRRRVKQLTEVPYTQKEAEAAIGLRTDNGESTVDAAASRQLIGQASQTGDIAMA
ncbi:c2h2 finger domain containing protein [Grosmannia clavigera kw1407]|uniref:C2h2 finger domain containing protein n=1 Tax=Grosmannia clavigera (strain kw1407 / UAMH 11150) TaxID=655863 RepID=F0XR90_GROCL|nr:c2h2 finger domain containing protein [Grosmannia clavigera kw1407]EFW99804.1 c2h2 finger domain containing protein [Grosmannia clavigera kw1407]